MATSSKGECEECNICRLHEIGVIQTPCEPLCYLEQPNQHTCNGVTVNTVAFEGSEKQSDKHVVRR